MRLTRGRLWSAKDLCNNLSGIGNLTDAAVSGLWQR